MAQEQAKLDWQQVNTDSFTGDMDKAYKAYTQAQAKARESWNAFLKVAQPKADKLAPEGQVAVFSHRFGKLAVAFKAAEEGKSKTSQDAVTL